MLLKTPEVREVHSGCYKIEVSEYSNFGDAETAAQVCERLWELLRPLHTLRRRLGAIFSHQWFLGFHNHTAFHQSYRSLLQS